MPGAAGQSRDVLGGAVRRVRAAGGTLMLCSPGERGREQTARSPGTWCVLPGENGACDTSADWLEGLWYGQVRSLSPHPANSWCRRVGGAMTFLSVLVFSFLQNPSQG